MPIVRQKQREHVSSDFSNSEENCGAHHMRALIVTGQPRARIGMAIEIARARVSLAEAAKVERVTPRVDEDVAHMRDEIKREDENAGHMRDPEEQAEDENDPDTEFDVDPPAGTKVAG
ncbi:hypothetical protein EW146_g1930 [Bondarzewia mesenterica]|uniref:Uncharacterized protein n=1 Tax=Bondarzewia mesenterica TaxID=1095465 RepID=A0A4S4M8I7_9AGAM|nr:hypothetical protein EW146_g1930 [Bondarzewia mesenterica]